MIALSFRLSVGKECASSLTKCPKKPDSIRIFLCDQCDAETAPCRLACKENAFVERNGVLTISEKCDRCGECANACPKGAILLNEKAVKCDLCADFDSPLCLSNNIHLEYFEKLPFGWELTKGEYKLDIPELTGDEKLLLTDIYEKFKEKTGAKDVGTSIKNFILTYCKDNNILLEKEQFDYLSALAISNIAFFGPFDQLFENDALEEITVVGNGPIYVYLSGKGWLRTNCHFYNEEKLLELANKMARQLGRRLTLKTPRINALLPNGDRMHASIPPISLAGIELTIRKFKKTPLSVSDLIKSNVFDSEAIAFLSMCMIADASILFAGNTASGKTSTLNALFSFVPDERIVILEETPEIKINQSQQVRMVANNVSMSDLIADTLRMRPDRTIVGEIRTKEEINAFFNTLLSGQARSVYATFHASSSEEALNRLEFMGITPSDINSLDLIVVQKRIMKVKLKKEVRKCTEIFDVKSKKNIFALEGDKLKLKTLNVAVVDKICESFDIDKNEFKKELKKRTLEFKRIL